MRIFMLAREGRRPKRFNAESSPSNFNNYKLSFFHSGNARSTCFWHRQLSSGLVLAWQEGAQQQHSLKTSNSWCFKHFDLHKLHVTSSISVVYHISESLPAGSSRHRQEASALLQQRTWTSCSTHQCQHHQQQQDSIE